MEKISIAFLTTVFIIANSTSAFLLFLIMLLSGTVELTYGTLFSIIYLTTYVFYGLSGVVYMTLSTMMLIVSMIMYWFNLSTVDTYERYKYAHVNTLKFGSTYDLDEHVNFLRKCRNDGLKKINDKLGITDEKYEEYKKQFDVVSRKFDTILTKIFEFFYPYLKHIRKYTNDSVPLKYIYLIYDFVIENNEYVKTNRIQNEFMMKKLRTMEKNMETILLSNEETNKMNDGNEMDNELDDVLDEPAENLYNMNTNNFHDINEQMEKEMKKIPPEQRRKMDEFAKQMFGNLNIDDMMKVLDGANNNMTRKRRK